MVNYADKELFNQDSLPKNLIITYDNVTLTNSDIVSESFELTETLCPDENITLGSCNASQVKFRIGYIAESLIGKTITVSIQPQGGAVLQIGVYKIATDTRTADRRYKDIVAYDVMYDILNTDVMDWYNTLFPNATTTKTVKQIRDSFFTYLGVTQESVTLINDTMTVPRTIDAEKLSGKDIITAICEANGCFGHIGRDGKFKYVYLAQLIEALYPSEDLYPAEDLYPSDGSGVTTVGGNGTYINVDYEDYSTASITKLQIRQEEDDIGVIVGSGTNSYIIEGNFLFFGMEQTPLTTAANNILTKLGLIAYRPSNIEVVGNPCFEVGDGVQIDTRYATIVTYILQRTLTGIQALKDNYVSTGTETRSEDVNSAHSQVLALRGRMNKLTRTLDETASELSQQIVDGDSNTLNTATSRISQSATEIKSTVSSSTSKYDTSGLTITYYSYGNPTSDYPSSPSSGQKYLDNSSGYVWTYSGTTWVRASNPLPLITNELHSEIVQTATQIKSTVGSAQSKYDTTGLTIDYYGYGGDATSLSALYPPASNNGKKYLDNNSGYVWTCNGSTWVRASSPLATVQSNLQSSITQTAESIESRVSADESVWDTTVDGSAVAVDVVFYDSNASTRPSPFNVNTYYLNQTTGTLWWRNYNNEYTHQCSRRSISASSAITQTAYQISLKVGQDGTGLQSAITMSPEALEFLANSIIIASTYFNLDAQGKGNLGGLVFDANGFYSEVNGDKVLRVYPNPSSGFALSVGENVRRQIGGSIVTDQAHFSIGHEGEVYVTKLSVLNEYDSGGRTSATGQLYVDDYIQINAGNLKVKKGASGSGQIYADDYMECGGNIESKRGSIYARYYQPSSGSGNVVAERYLFSSDGTVHTSDKRLKKNIKPLKDSEEFIYSLKPIEYRFRRDKENKKHHGLIAQDLQEANKDKEWNITPLMPDGEHYGICYEELIADLIKTVQSQNKRINELEERLARLEEKINAESIQ